MVFQLPKQSWNIVINIWQRGDWGQKPDIIIVSNLISIDILRDCQRETSKRKGVQREEKRREMVGPVRPQFVLFGSSIVQLSFSNGGWGAILADVYARKVLFFSILAPFFSGFFSVSLLSYVLLAYGLIDSLFMCIFNDKW